MVKYVINLLFIIVILNLLLLTAAQEDGPVKVTEYGSIRGTHETNNEGLDYEAYLGVPFAAPPLGLLRWEKPQPPTSWDEVLDTTSHAPPCTQLAYTTYNDTSEDCLYLNVFVPGTDRSDESLPVMFWIHGGGYIFGKPEGYVGYDLALRGDVIVVIGSYRMSTLGWLSTEDDVAPGNYGLWDIQRGLEWVRDNIAAFGGDPDSVTLFGQSVGGAMTSHAMISPQTNTLFNKGIAMSGHSSGFIGTSIPGKLANSTKTLANLVGCRFLNTSQELVDCLREKDAWELDFWGLVASSLVNEQLYSWIPRIDGDFITQHPQLSWEQGAASHIDYMTGNTFHDAASFILGASGAPNETFNFAETKERLNTTLDFATAHYPGDADEMRDAMFQVYPDLDNDDLENRTHETIVAATEWWIQTWAHYESSWHSATASGTKNTYLYNFRYDPSFLEYQFDWVTGSHSNDLWSVFGEDYRKDWLEEDLGGKSFSDEDKLVHEYMSAYYVNFARNGEPNVGVDVPTIWPLFEELTRSYIELSDLPQILQETEELRERYRFWVEEFPEVAFPPELEGFEHEETDLYTALSDDEQLETDIETAVEGIAMMLRESLVNHQDQLEDILLQIEIAMENRQKRLLEEM